MENEKVKSGIGVKIIFTILVAFISFFYLAYVMLLGSTSDTSVFLTILALPIVPTLIIPIWMKNKRKIFFVIWGIYLLVTLISFYINFEMLVQNVSI